MKRVLIGILFLFILSSCNEKVNNSNGGKLRGDIEILDSQRNTELSEEIIIKLDNGVQVLSYKLKDFPRTINDISIISFEKHENLYFEFESKGKILRGRKILIDSPGKLKIIDDKGIVIEEIVLNAFEQPKTELSYAEYFISENLRWQIDELSRLLNIFISTNKEFAVIHLNKTIHDEGNFVVMLNYAIGIKTVFEVKNARLDIRILKGEELESITILHTTNSLFSPLSLNSVFGDPEMRIIAEVKFDKNAKRGIADQSGVEDIDLNYENRYLELDANDIGRLIEKYGVKVLDSEDKMIVLGQALFKAAKSNGWKVINFVEGEEIDSYENLKSYIKEYIQQYVKDAATILNKITERHLLKQLLFMAEHNCNKVRINVSKLAKSPLKIDYATEISKLFPCERAMVLEEIEGFFLKRELLNQQFYEEDNQEMLNVEQKAASVIAFIEELKNPRSFLNLGNSWYDEKIYKLFKIYTWIWKNEEAAKALMSPLIYASRHCHDAKAEFIEKTYAALDEGFKDRKSLIKKYMVGDIKGPVALEIEMSLYKAKYDAFVFAVDALTKLYAVNDSESTRAGIWSKFCSQFGIDKRGDAFGTCYAARVDIKRFIKEFFTRYNINSMLQVFKTDDMRKLLIAGEDLVIAATLEPEQVGCFYLLRSEHLVTGK